MHSQYRNSTSKLLPILSIALVMGLLMCGIAHSVGTTGSKAPNFSTSLAKMSVKDLQVKPIPKSLADLAGNATTTVLYFWSAVDPSGNYKRELAILSELQRDRPRDLKIVAVAFQIGGDETNAKSRRYSAAHTDLGISFVFDDQRRLYEFYCPRDRSDVRSAFVIDMDGVVKGTRIGSERANDLSFWLDDVLPPPPPPGVPADIVGRPREQEITAALRLKYLALASNGRFNPRQPVLARNFMCCLRKAMKESGIDTSDLDQPSTPDQPITREQVAKLLVCNLLSAEEQERTLQLCASGFDPGDYISDFEDKQDTSRWAKRYVAIAVYKGWMVSDQGYLRPKQIADREYVASVLSRALPDPTAFTGLLVRLPKRLQGGTNVRIMPAGEDDMKKALYPNPMPPKSFQQAPGTVSWNRVVDPSGQPIKETEIVTTTPLGNSGSPCEIVLSKDTAQRVGKRPALIDATDIRQAPFSVMEVILDPDTTAKVLAANQKGLFLKTWRVGLLQPSSGTPSNAAKSGSSVSTAQPDKDKP